LTELDKSELLNLETSTDARPRSFAPAEMVTCEACRRANPPIRPTCLYCGERLSTAEPVEAPQAERDAAPAAAAAGFYVVLSVHTSEPLDESVLQQIATRSDLKLSDLQSVLRAGGAFPLVQANTNKQAEELNDGFRALGIQTTLVRNEELHADSVNNKIRALEFSDEGLTGLAGVSGERVFKRWSDLMLLVTGRLQMNNVEQVVRRKRSGHKPVDRRELTNDESIFDLYGRSATDGWRIAADNFDFSCLGARKGITAFENFRGLVNLLGERAENLEVDKTYLAVRPLLVKLWPLVASTRNGGWRRMSAGKFDMSMVTSTDNENQFTNYSRLLRCLKMRELGQNRLR
jgi:hypothetical protein